MEIKTEFFDEFANKIDKLLKHSSNHKIIIYNLIIPNVFGHKKYTNFKHKKL
jgi:hypothetical protein